MRVALVSSEVDTYVTEAGTALRAGGHEVWLITRDPGKESRQSLREHGAFDVVRFAEDACDDRESFHFALAHAAYRHSALVYATLRDAGVAFDYVEFVDTDAEGYVSLTEHRLFGSLGDALLGVRLHSPRRERFESNAQLHLMKVPDRELQVLEDATIRGAPVRTAASRRLLDRVAARLGVDGAGGRVVPYPLAAAPEPEPTRPRDSLAELRFGYFGPIEPGRGIDSLIEAFRRLPGLSLRLCGEDRPSSPHGTSYLEWSSRNLPANVTFEHAELRDTDVCVLPSTRDEWPETGIEAMAAARVVIGGRDSAISEWIEPGVSGFLVDGADPAAIVRAIETELGGALDRLDRIGRAAAARARELCDPVRYVDAIEALVREHRPTQTAVDVAGRRATIVVTYYDEDPEVLGQAVDSAIAQSHGGVEILIVSDGSPRADAGRILREMASRDPRVRVVEKANGGLASARNFAIEHATGDYLLFLDADNVLREDYVAVGLEVFARAPNAMAIAPWMQVFDARERRVIVNPLPFDPALAYFRNELGDAGAMFRAAVFREHGLRYDSMLDVYSDWALWLDCARLGLEVQCVPRVLYDYRLRGDSMMADQAWDRHLALLGLLIERHPLPGLDASHRELLTTLAQGWGIGAILAALGGRPEFIERPEEIARVHSGVRYQLADAIAKLADRVPGLSRALRPLGEYAIRLHGKWKDRRG